MSNGPTAIPVSPVNDMVAALNAALASHAKVPMLEASVDDLAKKLDTAQYHNLRLEENILGYKNTIADLTSKVRSLEVERDDAGFRTLEAEDKLANLLKTVRNAVFDLDDGAKHVDPPKPVPVVAEAPKADEVKGSSGDNPMPAPVALVETGNTADSGASNTNNASPQPMTPTSQEYKPFTPPSPSSKPVEITESGPYPWDNRESFR